MKVISRLTIIALAAAGASACSSLPYLGEPVSNGNGENYAAGSSLGPALSGEDERALETAFVAAMETGEVQIWRGNRASGEVRPGDFSLGNLKADPTTRVPAARGDFHVDSTLETDLGLYVLTRNANVRTGPGTEYAIADTLSSGDGVRVVGRTVNDSWMLASMDGVVRGYIFENLMIKAPGTELELAGGPRREPLACREFEQRLNRFSERDEWSGAACYQGGAWRLAAPAPGERGGPAILTD
ncbi:MAG: SH3 domain-containing protein [Pseudomonadota bacterium]